MTLANLWSQVWPNLAAELIWNIPLWVVAHTGMKRLLSREREHIARELREHLGIED